MTATPDATVRDIVTGDFRAAAVFHRYGIDFCCGGRQTLAEACRDRNLNAGAVLEELARTCEQPDATTPRYAEWEPETLMAFIVGNHHSYVRRTMPVINAYLEKLTAVHGERHPELREIGRLFAAITAEMTSHMFKEENVLFPYIAAVGDAAQCGDEPPPAPFGSIQNPIRMMEMEHESAGSVMADIRRLTNDYTPPEDGCGTYRVCLQELEGFERDLHAHVHLENNVLFPKALALVARAHP